MIQPTSFGDFPPGTQVTAAAIMGLHILGSIRHPAQVIDISSCDCLPTAPRHQFEWLHGTAVCTSANKASMINGSKNYPGATYDHDYYVIELSFDCRAYANVIILRDYSDSPNV